MNPRRKPIILPPALVAALLGAFALSGLLLGLLTHGLVISASANAPHATATAAHPHATPTHSKTPSATQPPATGRFDLALSVSPQRVSQGDSITVTVKATAMGTSAPLPNLLCVLSGDGSGPDLLTKWPAPQPTDAQGIATWHITIPQVAAGTYSIEVKASTTSPIYSAYRIALVFVNS